MEPAAPLSPAPSNDDIFQNGLHHLMRHNATTSYPRDHLSPDDMGRPGSHSRYGTPSPQHDMPYDHASPYQRGPDGQLYPSNFEPGNSSYSSLTGDPTHQPYSTPETSPPTPSRRPDGLTTRSGLTVQKGSTPVKQMATRTGRIEKPPPRKKRDRGKGGKKTDDIHRPLSEIAAEHPDAFIADIGAYVNRTREERLKEVEQSKTPGKIKRPMNAFMLYRKAYQNLAKQLCTQNNHQLVSQVCGSGWPLEPENIREQFNEWAKIERVNHQEAHPGYKFTPSKPKPKARDDDDLKSDDGDLDDYDWATGRSTSRRQQRARTPHGRQEAAGPVYHQMPNMAAPMNMGMPPQPMYHYGQPGRHMASPYNHAAMPPQPFYQQTVHQRHDNQGFVEDVMVKRTHSPQMTYAAPTADERYDMMPHYGQMSHNDLGLESMIDPGLVGPDGNPYPASGYADPLADSQHRWQNPLAMGDSRQDLQDGLSAYDDGFLHDPQMQLLRGQDSSWRVEELDGSHFNNWMEQGE